MLELIISSSGLYMFTQTFAKRHALCRQGGGGVETTAGEKTGYPFIALRSLKRTFHIF